MVQEREKLMSSSNVLPMFVNTIENSYKSIYLIGNNSVAEHLYKYLNGNNMVEVQWERNSESNVVFVPECVEIVIFTEEEHPSVCKQNGKGVYYVEYEKVKERNETTPFNDIYQNIIGQLLSTGVRILVVKTPDLHKYKHKIPLYISMFVYQQISRHLVNRDYVMLKHLKNEIVLQEFKKTKTDNLKGYNRVHGNGALINYDDGWRRVPYEGKMKDNACHIYLFGYCISANPMLSDCETVAANIQTLVGEKYRVCSRGNDGSAINFIMRGIRYRTGDIAVIFTSYHDTHAEKMGLEVVDLANVYLQIPKLWKHITDSSFHIDAFLAKQIAKEIYDRIISNERNEEIESEFCFGRGGGIGHRRYRCIMMYLWKNM